MDMAALYTVVLAYIVCEDASSKRACGGASTPISTNGQPAESIFAFVEGVPEAPFRRRSA